jgi:hypothetical protein
MTNDDLPLRLLDGPPLDGAEHRVARQRELGLSNVPDARFDALARKIVESTGALAAMVNFVGDQRQYFAGLAVNADAAPGDPALLGASTSGAGAAPSARRSSTTTARCSVPSARWIPRRAAAPSTAAGGSAASM